MPGYLSNPRQLYICWNTGQYTGYIWDITPLPVSTASLFFTLLNMPTSLHSFWLITSLGFNSPTEHLHIFLWIFFCFVLIKTFFSARLGHQFVGRRGHVKGVRHMGAPVAILSYEAASSKSVILILDSLPNCSPGAQIPMLPKHSFPFAVYASFPKGLLLQSHYIISPP